MESGDSCNCLRRSFPFHLGPYHQSDDAFGKKFWRALDAYSGDHGKVGKGNCCLLGFVWAEVMFGWLGQLWRNELEFWKVELMVLAGRVLVHPLLVGETDEGVG